MSSEVDLEEEEEEEEEEECSEGAAESRYAVNCNVFKKE